MTELNKSIATELVDLIDQHHDEKKSQSHKSIDELASGWWHKIRNEESLHNNWISWTKEEKIEFIEKSSNQRPSTICIPTPVCEPNDGYVPLIHKMNNENPSYMTKFSFSEFYNHVMANDTNTLFKK